MNVTFRTKLDELKAEENKVKSQKIYTHYEVSDYKLRYLAWGFLAGIFLMYVIVKLAS